MNIQIDCYKSAGKFLENLKEFDVCSNPYESYAFLSVYLKYYTNGNFYFFDIYEEGKKIAIVPMECTLDSKVLNTKYFRFIGYRQFNYEQYICRDEDVPKVHSIFMDYLSKQKFRSIVNFYDINDGTSLYGLLTEGTPRYKGLKLYICPCLHFTDNFEEFFKTVYSSAKKRTELKKFQKKLAEIGNFRILNINDKASYDTNKQYLEQIYRIHTERFAKVYATSFFGSPKMKPYYSELIESLMRDKKGYISLILIGETVIAFIFCLTNGETLIDWIPAFDPAYSKYNLGTVQYKMLFEEMCTPGNTYKTFDYSKGSSVYKRKWAKEETANYQFVIPTSKFNFFSWLLYFVEKNKFAFKCFLREKGVLAWIKRTLGQFLTIFKMKDEYHQNYKVVYDAKNDSGEMLSYSEYVTYPVEVRREILDAIYQGWKITNIAENADVISITMSK